LWWLQLELVKIHFVRVLNSIEEFSMSGHYVILDRDGTLIKHIHYLADPDQVELLPDVISGLTFLQNLGFSFGMITNQSIISRGMATLEQVEAVNKKVLQLLALEGITFSFVLLCPHTLEDGCNCRKPAPGLGYTAIEKFNISSKKSFMLGDQPSDVTFGHAIGCKSIQINTKADSNSEADYNSKTVLEAALWIESEVKRSFELNSRKVIANRAKELGEILPRFASECSDSLMSAGILISNAFSSGSKILICGNGGSAADSQHFAAEFVSSFSRDIERRGLPALALTVDTSIITAFSNDFSFENVFARQVEAYGRPGDVLIVLTTSGASQNCIAAVREAKNRGLNTIALTRTTGAISSEVDISIEVPSTNTQHIQECHMVAYHILTEIVEESLFGGNQK